MEALLNGWRTDIAAAGASAGDADLRAAGVELLARWSEPHRRYHTVDHLTAMLSHVDDLAEGNGAITVRLATWFHDAVYDPTRSGNEQASADLAVAGLERLGVPEQLAAEVARLILITASHDPAPDDRDGALLCDADLAILAARPSAYRRYADAVRTEYGHLDNATFRAGRGAVLRSLLARPHLYNLDAARDKWERRARINLAIEASALTAGG